MLEGFVLRLAQRPDADAFVLRGGMLVRHWFPDALRPALDLDLVCTLPFAPKDLRHRLTSVLEVHLDDGVLFNAERSRIDAIWADTAAPGLRLFALAAADGQLAELRVDVTFGLTLWPEPVRGRFVTPRGAASVLMCRPESLIGRKLQVMASLGHQRWRPKDLSDVRLMLGRFEERARLGEAIEASLVDCAESLQDIRELFDAAWWENPGAQGRWQRFSCGTHERSVPELACVVAEVRSHLHSILGKSR